ncbi:MAG: hypothetical protein ACI4DY_12000 [Monoglobaceae bacterium]
METTLTLARALGMSPLDVMAHDDTDEIIMLINYYIKKGENTPKEQTAKQPMKDNFWDF